MILLRHDRRGSRCGRCVVAAYLVKAGPGEEVGNEEFGLLLMAIRGPVNGLDRFPIQRLDGLQR